LAKLEDPACRIVRGLPAFRKLGAQRTVRGNLGEIVPELAGAEIDHEGIEDLCGIQRIAGAATGQPLAINTPSFRRRQGFAHHAFGGHHRGTQCQSTFHKAPPAKLSLGELPL